MPKAILELEMPESCWQCPLQAIEKKIKYCTVIRYSIDYYGTKRRENCPLKPMNEYKYDQGKPRLDLVPPGIIEAIGIVRTYGMQKYKTEDGWQNVEPKRYVAALMRHLCKFLRDPYAVDPESGLPHLWHMACNVAFLIEFYWPHGRI